MKRVDESATVAIRVGQYVIHGDLRMRAETKGAVIFAHGSGSSRQSPRNRYVAEILNGSGLATLLLDLLTFDEESVDNRTAEFRFDVPLLAERLVAATDWAQQQPALSGVPLGYFGASTGAAAALVAAARRPNIIGAVVSRGGRPDLAGDDLERVPAPTLLIVGEYDRQVLALNREAAGRMRGLVQLGIVPGATHLFEERGALAQVAALARKWFEEKLLFRRAA